MLAKIISDLSGRVLDPNRFPYYTIEYTQETSIRSGLL